MYSKDQGGISWIDLTVKDAGGVRDFYQSVVGLNSESLSMGDYDDYVMSSPINADQQVGICHARGVNADVPPQWLIYFNVDNVQTAVDLCMEKGGEVIRKPKDVGDYIMAIIKDPSGAAVGLISAK